MKTAKQEAMTKKEQIIEALYKRRDEFISQRKKIKASETSEDIRRLDDAIQTILTYMPPEYFYETDKWVNIESKKDLPKDINQDEILFVMVKGQGVSYATIRDIKRCDGYLCTFTHYQPIQKPEPPIY
jgi:hypothetical protein